MNRKVIEGDEALRCFGWHNLRVGVCRTFPTINPGNSCELSLLVWLAKRHDINCELFLFGQVENAHLGNYDYDHLTFRLPWDIR